MNRSWVTILGVALAMIGNAWAAGIPDVLPDPDGKPADMSKPVKVFILMGQSNMLGFGTVSGGAKSVEHACKNENKYPYLIDDDGNWTVRKDVRNVRVMCSGGGPWSTHLNQWLSLSGNGKIGPEHGIGHYVGHVLGEPVLILKSCIGNRSLGWDLLPPGADGYQGNPEMPRKPRPLNAGEKWYAGLQYDGDVRAALEVLEDLGTYYPGAKDYEVAGFFFWQGAKDCGGGGSADNYEKNLVQLIKALRKDFNAPDGLFVCATMGNGIKGGGGAAGKVTDAQLAVDGLNGKYPEFKDTVRTFYSNPVSMGSSANGHYGGHGQTYMNVGVGMGKAMAELLVARGASGGARSSTGQASAPAQRPARSVSPDKMAALDRALLSTLVKLNDAGKLDATPIPLSMTRARVSLVSAHADGTLSFRAASGKTVPFAFEKLTPGDHANLAILVSKLKPESGDAKGMAAVYMESLGQVAAADKYFGNAGATSRKKMEKLFD